MRPILIRSRVCPEERLLILKIMLRLILVKAVVFRHVLLCITDSAHSTLLEHLLVLENRIRVKAIWHLFILILDGWRPLWLPFIVDCIY